MKFKIGKYHIRIGKKKAANDSPSTELLSANDASDLHDSFPPDLENAEHYENDREMEAFPAPHSQKTRNRPRLLSDSRQPRAVESSEPLRSSASESQQLLSESFISLQEQANDLPDTALEDLEEIPPEELGNLLKTLDQTPTLSTPTSDQPEQEENIEASQILSEPLRKNNPLLFIYQLTQQPAENASMISQKDRHDFITAEEELLRRYHNDPSYKLLLNELESHRHKFITPKTGKVTITFIIMNIAILLALLIGKVVSFLSRNQLSGAILEGTKTTLSTIMNDSLGAGIQLILFPYVCYKTIYNKRKTAKQKTLHIMNNGLISGLKSSGFILLAFSFPLLTVGFFIAAHVIEVIREAFKLRRAFILSSKLKRLHPIPEQDKNNDPDAERIRIYFNYKKRSLAYKTAATTLMVGLVAVGLFARPIGTLAAIVGMIVLALGTRRRCNHLKNKARNEYKKILLEQKINVSNLLTEGTAPQQQNPKFLARTTTVAAIRRPSKDSSSSTLLTSSAGKRGTWRGTPTKKEQNLEDSVSAMPEAKEIAHLRDKGLALKEIEKHYKGKSFEELLQHTTFWKQQQKTKISKVSMLEEFSRVLVTATAALR